MLMAQANFICSGWINSATCTFAQALMEWVCSQPLWELVATPLSKSCHRRGGGVSHKYFVVSLHALELFSLWNVTSLHMGVGVCWYYCRHNWGEWTGLHSFTKDVFYKEVKWTKETGVRHSDVWKTRSSLAVTARERWQLTYQRQVIFFPKKGSQV